MKIRRVHSFTAVAAVAATGLAMAAPVGAKTPVAFTAYTVGSLPDTPAQYNKVFVTKYGSPKAKKVLVLIPGTNGGAGNFSVIGPELARKVPGLQVWAMDRRTQALEDTSVMRQAATGKATAQQVLDYYLPGAKQQFKPHEAKDFQFMKHWGMQMQLEDARVVIKAAAQGGKTVILGGHSLGASMAAAYAAWDFGGSPGYKDIAGIVAIDGGLLGSVDSSDTAEKAEAELAKLNVTPENPDGPWANLLGLKGFAWATGPFAETGAIAARQAPRAASVLQGYPLLPANLKAPVPSTNEAALGYAFDYRTSPPGLALIQVRSGKLAPSGAPRGWKDAGITPVQNLARGFAGDRNGTNGVDWYYPRRLNVDTDGASSMDPENPAAKVLGLRLQHLAEVNIPYYAFQTSLTGSRNGVVNGAKNFAARSTVPKGGLVIVDRSKTTSHLDPLLAAPKRNDFVKTVVPFLAKKIR
ncbi:MAG: hypothetical protein ACKOTA_08650 [Solirubrobacterales bacterium]